MTAAVLCYHRVSDDTFDPHGLAIGSDDFADHIEVLARRWGIVPLEQIHDTAGIAITFDDGYADNALVAAPILQRLDAPATFFVTTGLIGREAAFWWDRLAAVLLDGRDLPEHWDLVAAGRSRRVDLRRPLDRARAHAWLQRLLMPLPTDEIDAVISQLVADDHRTDAPRAMCPDELQGLARCELFEVGAHSVTHPVLATQTERVQAAEIGGSRRHLEDLLERPVTSFAYPFGSGDTIDDVTVRLTREAGFRLACTTRHRRVDRERDRLRCPRFVVGGQWDAAHLERQLDTWLTSSR